MDLTPEDRVELQQIFFAGFDDKLKKIREDKDRFVYYTSADTAINIIKNKQIWLRNATAMNDYSEIDYGFQCLNEAYKSNVGTKFNTLLDSFYPGLAKELKDMFNTLLPAMSRETFITCLSEHLSSEDLHGRLSMWRAYGGHTGVALVINSDVILSEAVVLNIHSGAVNYFSKAQFMDDFAKITDRMEQRVDLLKRLDREVIKNMVFYLFRYFTLCTKHPGFLEEREWRIIAQPDLYPSDYLSQSVELVNGIPQNVLKLDLVNHEDKGLTGLAIQDLLNRIIIGPCEFPYLVYKAFLKLLIENDIPEPEEKLVISDIPLRKTWK